jgi:Mrp family chromosome partitioning ATPase
MSRFFEALERADREEPSQMSVAAPVESAPVTPHREGPSPTTVTATTVTAPTVTAPVESAPVMPPRPAPPVFEAPAPTTARVRADGVEEHLVSLLEPRSFEAEEYRLIRHAVETLRRDANLQIVAVTSPGGGDGKTATAINLAGALAQSRDARVLLADLDLRRPAVARQLGLGGRRRSLVDALRVPGIGLAETVERLPRFNLSVALVDGSVAAPYELLKSPRLQALFEDARQRYDYVVLDTPPFVPVPDGRLVTKCVDGFVIVVAAHRTPRSALAETLNLIEPAKVVGLVFNGHAAGHRDYYRSNTDPPRGSRWRVGKRR